MKHSKKMVKTRESGPCRDIGDRERSCLQKFLCMVNSHPQDFVKHGTPEFFAKGAFKGSPWNSAVGDNVVHRQIPSGKVSLDVSQSGAHLRVFDGKDLGALASNDSLWWDPLRNLWWRLAIDQAVKQSRCLVRHSLEIVADAPERHLHAIANDMINSYASKRELVGN